MLYFVIIISTSLLISQTTPTLSSLIHKIIFKRPSESDFAFLIGDDSSETQNFVKKDTVCDEKKLMLRLAKMKVISPERIVLMLTSDNLNDLCRKLGTNIDEVKHDFKSCVPLKKDNLYWMLFKGIQIMHGKLCNSTVLDKPMQNLFDNRDCITELREEYIDCEGPADWIEKENQSILCEKTRTRFIDVLILEKLNAESFASLNIRIYRDILNCQFVKTAEVCGLEVAHALNLLSNTVFDGTLVTQCSVYEAPHISNPMPFGIHCVASVIFTTRFTHMLMASKIQPKHILVFSLPPPQQKNDSTSSFWLGYISPDCNTFSVRSFTLQRRCRQC